MEPFKRRFVYFISDYPCKTRAKSGALVRTILFVFQQGAPSDDTVMVVNSALSPPDGADGGGEVQCFRGLRCEFYSTSLRGQLRARAVENKKI